MIDPTTEARPTYIVRLWDLTINEFLWASDQQGELTALDEFLRGQPGWTGATLDKSAGDGTGGRLWAGRLRLGDDGLIEARPELAFLAPVLYGDDPLLPPAGDVTFSPAEPTPEVPADE